MTTTLGQRGCRIDGCERPHNSHGLCLTHDLRRRKGTRLDDPIPERTPGGRRCTVTHCDRAGFAASGLCRSHERRRKQGRPLDAPFRQTMRQPPECSHPGCDRKPLARGLCDPHVRQLYKKGHTTDLRQWSMHDECTYNAVHIRCRTLWGSPRQYQCIECGRSAHQWAYDGTDPDEMLEIRDGSVASVCPYSRYPEFYMPMCGSCHRRRDIESLKNMLAEFRAWRASRVRKAA